jgi:hypothetical protein
MLLPPPSSHDALLLLFKVLYSTKAFLQSLPFLVSLLDCFIRLVCKASTYIYTVQQVPIKGKMPLWLER